MLGDPRELQVPEEGCRWGCLLCPAYLAWAVITEALGSAITIARSHPPFSGSGET